MQRKIISLIILCSTIFFVAVAIDISPFLRGPGEYMPDWRWHYYFVADTIFRIWAPGLLIVALLVFILRFDNQVSKIEKKEKALLVFLIFWLYIFILSVLFFSRSGVLVLIERIINPGSNGQFTASLGITNIFSFFPNFNHIVSTLEQHAKSHPPGGVVMFWFFNAIFQFFPKDNFISNVVLSGSDFSKIWNGLLSNQKLTAVFSSFFIPFLLTLPILPIYYLGKLLFNIKIALRSVVIYATIPSVIFFVPLLDAFYTIFPMVALILVINGINKKNIYLMFLSGLVMGLGLFFTLSILPFLLIYLNVLFILLYKNKKEYEFLSKLFKYYYYIILGILTFISLLFIIFKINLIETFFSIKLVYRSYFPWVFYNLYDFFVFTGIPVFIVFALLLKDSVKKIKSYKFIKENLLFISFLITLVTVDVLGVVRGETGRIYLLFVPVLVIVIAQFLTKTIKLNTKLFIVFILIQLIQVLVMQEFWVMLW